VVLSTPELYPLTIGLASWNDLAGAGAGRTVCILW
jgi:hypothetical protein